MASCRLLLMLLVVMVTLYSTNCDTTFDCRRKGQDCKANAPCESGTCNCAGLAPPREGFNCDILTESKNADQAACGCANGGVCMADDTCKCNEKFYGDKCQYKRDEILCFGDRKIIFIYPVGFTHGTVFITGKRNESSCIFTKVKDVTDKADFKDEWTAAGGEGFVLRIMDVDPTCGNITQTSTADSTTITYTRSANLEFDGAIITSLDELIDAKCEMVNDTLRSTGILVPTALSPNAYIPGEIINKYEPLLFAALHNDAAITSSSIAVGETITFRFNIPAETGYETLIIESLEANDTATKIDLVKDKCPTQDSSSIIESITKSEDGRTVNLLIKVFKFVGSEEISFLGMARICKPGEGVCTERTDCTANNGVKGLGRRKRESGDSLTINEKIRVTTDPYAATSNSQGATENCPETPSSNEEEIHCLQRTEIVIVIAMMAATIIILLIACMVLTWRLLRTSPKVAELHPSEYGSGRSIPRLTPTNF